MKKILVVVGMQNDFVDGALGTEEAVRIVENVANKIKNFNGTIFATLDNHHGNLTAREKLRLIRNCYPICHSLNQAYILIVMII